jgi:hypothetical protein
LPASFGAAGRVGAPGGRGGADLPRDRDVQLFMLHLAAHDARLIGRHGCAVVRELLIRTMGQSDTERAQRTWWSGTVGLIAALVGATVVACSSASPNNQTPTSPDDSSAGSAVREPSRPQWADYLDDAEATAKLPAAVAALSPVQVDGRTFQTNCVGDGEPTVILVSGYLAPLENWIDVQRKIGTLTRVCSYDRLGIGASGPLPES